MTGKITHIIDLSKTAKEITISLPKPLEFRAGSFVNVFMDINGQKIRRAYSISSSEQNTQQITITVRLSPDGAMTPIFWNQDMIGHQIELMGPLGVNTVDKMHHKKIYLFAFGVGAGVVRSIAEHFIHRDPLEHLTIVTGSKSENEMLYQEYFDQLSHESAVVKTLHVVSKPNEGSNIPKGYIQHHIDIFDFNHSDVYICGQESACADLVNKIKSTNPDDCEFFIEAFHR